MDKKIYNYFRLKKTAFTVRTCINDFCPDFITNTKIGKGLHCIFSGQTDVKLTLFSPQESLILMFILSEEMKG